VFFCISKKVKTQKRIGLGTILETTWR